MLRPSLGSVGLGRIAVLPSKKMARAVVGVGDGGGKPSSRVGLAPLSRPSRVEHCTVEA